MQTEVQAGRGSACPQVGLRASPEDTRSCAACFRGAAYMAEREGQRWRAIITDGQVFEQCLNVERSVRKSDVTLPKQRAAVAGARRQWLCRDAFDAAVGCSIFVVPSVSHRWRSPARASHSARRAKGWRKRFRHRAFFETHLLTPPGLDRRRAATVGRRKQGSTLTRERFLPEFGFRRLGGQLTGRAGISRSTEGKSN